MPPEPPALRFLPASPGNRFRAARFALFQRLVERVLAARGACAIIDLGGLPGYWQSYGEALLADPRIAITLVNLGYTEAERAAASGRFTLLEGDARSLPDLAGAAFDLAHSNSVIEHVGRWADMAAMATEICRIARAHYVQTPYWGFPLEPHCRTPFFHWLPEQWRYRLVLRRRLGFWPRATSVDQAMRQVQSNALLDRGQFAALFPGSNIHAEVVWGLTKSLVAVGGEGVSLDPRSNTRRLRVA